MSKVLTKEHYLWFNCFCINNNTDEIIKRENWIEALFNALFKLSLMNLKLYFMQRTSSKIPIKIDIILLDTALWNKLKICLEKRSSETNSGFAINLNTLFITRILKKT